MEKAYVENLLAHWSANLAGVQIRPSVFYGMVEENISAKQIPRIRISRVFRREGGLISDRRQYLRVKYKQLVFDICGFPICGSFAVSYWLELHDKTVANLFFEIPILGFVLERAFSPATYFNVDADAACQHAVHDSVLSVVDELTHENHLTRLTGQAREPIFADFYE